MPEEEEKSVYKDRDKRFDDLKATATSSNNIKRRKRINEDVSLSLDDPIPKEMSKIGKSEPPLISKEPWMDEWDKQIEALRKKHFEAYGDN